MSEVVDLALRLVAVESTTGHEGPMADVLETWLKDRGWRVCRQEVEPGRDNVLALRPGGRSRVLLNTHIDTVPPHFGPRREGDWIYGRGACDTKGLLAAQLLAAQSLVEQGYTDLGLLYVVGEESDHCGMRAANALDLDPEYLIVGEPTEGKLARRQKGMLKLRLAAEGKTAHSGYPEQGISAVDSLLDVLEELRRHPWPRDPELGATTLNIGRLGGGRAANVVPDEAWTEVMFRVVTPQQRILRKVRTIVGGRVRISVIGANDPAELTTLEGYDTSVIAFNTDIPHFRFRGRALLWGPGSILDAHTQHERVRAEDLERAVDVYADLVRRCGA